MAEQKTINGELCERVPGPLDLRVADLIYIYCFPQPSHPVFPGGCGTFHRGIVIGYEAERRTRGVIVEHVWTFAPIASCNGGNAISHGAFVGGGVWRVVQATDRGAQELEGVRLYRNMPRAVRVGK